MRGHQPLVDMRRAGMLPGPAVWVEDVDCPLGNWLSRNWHGLTTDGKAQPHIVVDDTDVIEVLDFRCLRGLIVHLRADRSDDRAKRLFSAIRKVQPKVLACVRGTETWLYRNEEGGNGKRIPA
ncbi:MAG: hypothetical protein ACI4QS_10875 [Comamonas sp.]